jgi:hypothetical protein
MNLYGSQPWNKVEAHAAPEKRPWVVIHDPSEAQDLINRAFRTVDVEKDTRWCEEGVVIWNRNNGEARVFRSGRFVAYSLRDGK